MINFVIHEYERVKLQGGSYDVDHPDRVDGAGKKITLAKEIETQFASKIFRVRCDDDVLKILVNEDQDFTPAQKLILDQIVADHKANEV